MKQDQHKKRTTLLKMYSALLKMKRSFENLTVNLGLV